MCSLYVCDLLTSVCTIAGLCVLSIFTVWKMSTTPSYLIRSKTMLRVMKTPVRPTPALSKRRHRVHKDARKWCCIYQDTVAVSQNIVLADFALTGTFSPSISAAGCLPTVDRDRSILAKLLFCFMDLADEVDESFSWLWHSLFGPVRELKLPYCPWLPILYIKMIGNEEFTEQMKLRESHCRSSAHCCCSFYDCHSDPPLYGFSSARWCTCRKSAQAPYLKHHRKCFVLADAWYFSWMY